MKISLRQILAKAILLLTICSASLFASHSFAQNTYHDFFSNFDRELLQDIDREALALLKENKLSEARNLITEAIDESGFSGNPRVLIHRLIIRAHIDQKVGSNIGALQDLQFAFRLAASTNHQDSLADIAYIIASIHQSRNEYSIALSYIDQAIERYQSLENKEKVSDSLLLSIACLLATRQLDLADEQLQQVRPLIDNNNDKNNRVVRYFQYLGEAELLRENINASISALETALDKLGTVDSQDKQQTAANLHLLLSRAYADSDKMDEAIENLVIAFDFANQAGNGFYIKQALQLHRAVLLARLQEFEAAFLVTQDILKNRDLNQPIGEIKRMLDMHANFQLELQQQENAELKEENKSKAIQIENKQTLNRLYFLIIALLFSSSCLLLLLFIRNRKHRISLEKIAHTDALTGLYSRTRTLELLNHHQDLYGRSQQPYCVAIVDLDHFKAINDNYGHPVGDKVLIAFGELCESSFRKSDIIGRIGGEEFLFILPNTSADKAIEVFNSFKDKLPVIAQSLNLQQKTTASIGVVQPSLNEETMQIIKRADSALYAAKRRGRDLVIFENNITKS